MQAFVQNDFRRGFPLQYFLNFKILYSKSFPVIFLLFSVSYASGGSRNSLPPGYASVYSADSIPVSIQFSNAVQKPLYVPVIAPLSRSTPYFDGRMMGRAADANDYHLIVKAVS
jgi:hypothetical protein